MKFGRKMAALILAVVMVLMVLGACSEGSASGDVSDNGIEAAALEGKSEEEMTEMIEELEKYLSENEL